MNNSKDDLQVLVAVAISMAVGDSGVTEGVQVKTPSLGTCQA